MLKRDNWSNDQIIDIIEGLMLSIKMDNAKNWGQEECDIAVNWNTALQTAASRFYDFKRYPNEHSAMALDIETNQIVVIGPPLPQ